MTQERRNLSEGGSPSDTGLPRTTLAAKTIPQRLQASSALQCTVGRMEEGKGFFYNLMGGGSLYHISDARQAEFKWRGNP